MKSLRLVNLTKNLVTASVKQFSAKQKHIFFFGAPGVGKGTYAQILAKDLGFNQISTGDEIRKILKGQAAEGFDKSLIKEIKEIVSTGRLVNDDIVISIMEEKLKEPASQKGVIFDGFPRTLTQLEKYEKKYKTDLVVNIFLNYSVLLEKLMGRRTCVDCGASYNLCNIQRDGYVMSPLLTKKEGICDVCGGKLITRPDDTESVITKRMTEYNEKTAPLLDVYEKRGNLFNFEPKRGKKDYKRFYEQVKVLIDKIQ